MERLGLHCPAEIYEAVRDDAAATAEKRERAVALKDHRDQEQAKALLLQFFPQIPQNSLNTVLEHGFLKGSGRVGRSTKLDEEVKTRLAVIAHIRHNFTKYDEIYQQMKANTPASELKEIVRFMVRDEVMTIADYWRGKTINQKNIPSFTPEHQPKKYDEILRKMESVNMNDDISQNSISSARSQLMRPNHNAPKDAQLTTSPMEPESAKIFQSSPSASKKCLEPDREELEKKFYRMQLDEGISAEISESAATTMHSSVASYHQEEVKIAMMKDFDNLLVDPDSQLDPLKWRRLRYIWQNMDRTYRDSVAMGSRKGSYLHYIRRFRNQQKRLRRATQKKMQKAGNQGLPSEPHVPISSKDTKVWGKAARKRNSRAWKSPNSNYKIGKVYEKDDSGHDLTRSNDSKQAEHSECMETS